MVCYIYVVYILYLVIPIAAKVRSLYEYFLFDYHSCMGVAGAVMYSLCNICHM